MTIIDRINLHMPLIQAEQANCIMLGNVECSAMIAACELIYNLVLPRDEIHTKSVFFRGLQIIPVHQPSFFAVARIIQQETDDAIRI